MLTGICVKSKDKLMEHIYKYFEEINAVPVQYKWKYKMDTINLDEEDVSEIIYEVVNEKAAVLITKENVCQQSRGVAAKKAVDTAPEF